MLSSLIWGELCAPSPVLRHLCNCFGVIDPRTGDHDVLNLFSFPRNFLTRGEKNRGFLQSSGSSIQSTGPGIKRWHRLRRDGPLTNLSLTKMILIESTQYIQAFHNRLIRQHQQEVLSIFRQLIFLTFFYPPVWPTHLLNTTVFWFGSQMTWG